MTEEKWRPRVLRKSTPMKIQPIVDSGSPKPIKNEAATTKPAAKSRLKRMLERQFPGVLRNSLSERAGEPHGGSDTEPSSVCLAKMVQNFMEDNDKQAKCGRSRCNCFNGNGSDSSDDEQDAGDSTLLSGEGPELLKSLVQCASMAERNLLADTAKIVESRSKSCRKNVSLREFVEEGLLTLGYDASICRSKWEQSPSHPAGEYEYIDVIVAKAEGPPERLIVDVDFKSEFEIARSTSQYRAVLQSLPSIFVGKPDRLQQIVSLVSEAARHSLKKKGLHFPPWRKPEYMSAKWLSPYKRTKASADDDKMNAFAATAPTPAAAATPTTDLSLIAVKPSGLSTTSFSGEFELRFSGNDGESKASDGAGGQVKVVVTEWTLPAVKPKIAHKEGKIVTGLASVLREKP
ncbi:uncharacterized protein LOC116248719 [Nymphaea colorata]|nr:uncharacterized protein LOC116248719 [Nymphaea colorata]